MMPAPRTVRLRAHALCMLYACYLHAICMLYACYYMLLHATCFLLMRAACAAYGVISQGSHGICML